MDLNRQCVQINKINYLFTKLNNSPDFDIGKHLWVKKVNKTGKRESNFANKSLIAFEVTDYVGNPNFIRIQDTFAFITKACVGQVYLENYLYKQYSEIRQEITLFNKEQKKRESMEKQPVEPFLQQKIYPLLATSIREFKILLNHIQSFLFFKFTSNPELLLKDKTFYFRHFLQQFVSIIKFYQRAQSNVNLLKFQILFYGKNQQNQYIFVEGDIGNIQTFNNELEKVMKEHQFSKIGFLSSDFMSVIKNALPQTSI